MSIYSSACNSRRRPSGSYLWLKTIKVKIGIWFIHTRTVPPLLFLSVRSMSGRVGVHERRITPLDALIFDHRTTERRCGSSRYFPPVVMDKVF